ncbi:MAG: hypothetical protein ACK55Z_32580, partial [bacterium]
VIEPAGRVDENNLAVALQRHENAVVELGVLPHPGVAVVQVGQVDVLVGHLRQHDKPLLEEFRAKSVVGAGVREVHHQLERLVAEGLQGENDVIDEQVPVRLADLVAPRNVVEDGKTGPRRARLIEYIQ